MGCASSYYGDKIMTRQEAMDVAEFIRLRLDGKKLWSVTVSETRKVDPEKPTKYRVVIEAAGSDNPIAIYSARVLSRRPTGMSMEVKS
jgi:hypothetical protein